VPYPAARKDCSDGKTHNQHCSVILLYADSVTNAKRKMSDFGHDLVRICIKLAKGSNDIADSSHEL
jgi:hypothetical protein